MHKQQMYISKGTCDYLEIALPHAVVADFSLNLAMVDLNLTMPMPRI